LKFIILFFNNKNDKFFYNKSIKKQIIKLIYHFYNKIFYFDILFYIVLKKEMERILKSLQREALKSIQNHYDETAPSLDVSAPLSENFQPAIAFTHNKRPSGISLARASPHRAGLLQYTSGAGKHQITATAYTLRARPYTTLLTAGRAPSQGSAA